MPPKSPEGPWPKPRKAPSPPGRRSRRLRVGSALGFKSPLYFDKLGTAPRRGEAQGIRPFRAPRGKSELQMIYDLPFETMPRPELERLQLERLQSTLRLAAAKSPFYRRRFKEIGFEPGDLRSLSDLSKLPLPLKEDLSDGYPEGFSAIAPEEVVRYHASSGSTGRPTVTGLTRGDLDQWTRLMARCLSAADVTDRDVVNVAFNYGLFTGGLGFHYGAEAIGAAVLPCSVGASHRQVGLMSRLKATVLC